jgi:hypothetical protein
MMVSAEVTSETMDGIDTKIVAVPNSCYSIISIAPNILDLVNAT